MQIKIYGEQAREIENGQVFIAKVTSIEGRDVVVLEPSINIDRDYCPSFEVRYWNSLQRVQTPIVRNVVEREYVIMHEARIHIQITVMFAFLMDMMREMMNMTDGGITNESL